MGSATGAIKAAARRLGISETDYVARTAAGLKWCTACSAWHALTMFPKDGSRGDGVSASCAIAQRARYRRTYAPKPRPASGRRFKAARPDDRKQARRRVNHLVDIGTLPRPAHVPCADCGHSGPDRRHEYDHHLGYAPEHHEHVEAVCSQCHRKRAIARGEWKRHV